MQTIRRKFTDKGIQPDLQFTGLRYSALCPSSAKSATPKIATTRQAATEMDIPQSTGPIERTGYRFTERWSGRNSVYHLSHSCTGFTKPLPAIRSGSHPTDTGVSTTHNRGMSVEFRKNNPYPTIYSNGAERLSALPLWNRFPIPSFGRSDPDSLWNWYRKG